MITDHSAFHALGLSGTYSNMNIESAGKRTVSYNKSIFRSEKFMSEIKEWKPEHLFSFGYPDNNLPFK